MRYFRKIHHPSLENIIYEVRKNSLVGDLPQMLADRYTYFLYRTELSGKKIGLA